MKFFLAILLALTFVAPSSWSRDLPANASNQTNVMFKFRSPEDGWLDAGGFLGEKCGFLPVVIPITEPAVGYGGAGGLTFLSRPLPGAEAGLGRPNITMVGGSGTQNGTWGAVAGDLRHWVDNRLQTLVGDDSFQRARLIVMQCISMDPRWYRGLRADGAARFGNEPFYLRPFINLRGPPLLRYQSEEVAQIEAVLRWQFWKRFSLVGFAEGGCAWNRFEKFDSSQTIVTGGTGFRYEIARDY